MNRIVMTTIAAFLLALPAMPGAVAHTCKATDDYACDAHRCRGSRDHYHTHDVRWSPDHYCRSYGSVVSGIGNGAAFLIEYGIVLDDVPCAGRVGIEIPTALGIGGSLVTLEAPAMPALPASPSCPTGYGITYLGEGVPVRA